MRSYMDYLYGNTEAKESLCRAAEKDAFPHALIIEGAEGSGKKTFAVGLISALLCENKNDATHPLPCRACRTCRIIESGNAVDVKWITREDKATIGVDAVRDIKRDMYLSSTELAYKIYVIVDAHTMTVQAQNALLIALEEPPPSVKILLLCETADALLTTIRSRARLVRMSKFSTEELSLQIKRLAPDLWKKYDSDPILAADVLTDADGSLGKAMSLLEPKEAKELSEERRIIRDLIDSFSSPSYAKIHHAVSALSVKRDELTAELLLLTRAIRDLILLKKAKDAPLCFYGSREAALEKSRVFRLPLLLRIMQSTEEAIERLERNANVATVLNAFKCSLKKG